MQQNTFGISSTTFNYFAFGIYIESEIQLPELGLGVSEHPAVSIKFGKVPTSLKDGVQAGPLRQVSKNEFLLDIPNVARFLVKGNREVFIDTYEDADEQVIRIHLLSTLMAVLLHKHDLLALHASSIKVNGGAILISGASGAGKSTTALGLYKKGYEILNDDISSVFIDENGVASVYAGTVRLKLWSASLEKLGYDIEQYMPVRKNLEKYNFPIGQHSAYEPAAIKAIFFINAQNCSEISHRQLKGLQVFDNLKVNTFKYGLVKNLKKNASHFKICSSLASTLPFISISRPMDVHPQKLINYIEDLVKQYAV